MTKVVTHLHGEKHESVLAALTHKKVWSILTTYPVLVAVARLPERQLLLPDASSVVAHLKFVNRKYTLHVSLRLVEKYRGTKEAWALFTCT